MTLHVSTGLLGAMGSGLPKFKNIPESRGIVESLDSIEVRCDSSPVISLCSPVQRRN